MKVWISIDDTDRLGSPGTGHHAEALRKKIEAAGLGTTQYITRHQLYVHNDVPYTSHNSAMCFEASLTEDSLEAVITLAQDHLLEVSEVGSDPGLCVAPWDQIQNMAQLIAFGKQAKAGLVTKAMAYELAENTKVHLSEHGGTGGGVIGAIAGVGLRLSGHDGRVKGKIYAGAAGDSLTAAELKKLTGAQRVCGLDGTVIDDTAAITLSEEMVKMLYLNWDRTILVHKENGAGWQTLPKSGCRSY